MDFESMTGTSGIASAYNKMYVVDNDAILIVDQYNEAERVKHSFDWITNIATSELQLFGIYNKDEKYGLFSMDFTSHRFKMVPLNYTAVNLIYHDQLVIVFDNNMGYYCYERNLTLRYDKNPLPKDVSQNTVTFMTVGLTKSDENIYYSMDKDIYETGKKLFSMEGQVLSMIWYKKFLFFAYVSLYNHYSILQYDLLNKKRVKTVEGGYISGPPIYSCIYQDSLYVSASTNNIIDMDEFDFPDEAPSGEEVKPRSIFPMFELNKINHRFLTDEANIDLERLKALQDYGKVETDPAQTSLIRYYIWMCIFLFIGIAVILAITFKENSLYPVILLCTLFIALSFLIKNNIPI